MIALSILILVSLFVLAIQYRSEVKRLEDHHHDHIDPYLERMEQIRRGETQRPAPELDPEHELYL